jgi:hypothetical protein
MPDAAAAYAHRAMREAFTIGAAAADAEPGVFIPECWSTAELQREALRAAYQLSAREQAKTVEAANRLAALREGWRRLYQDGGS